MQSPEIAPKYEMTFGRAERLGVFEQYRFFTPALLYLHGRLTDAHLLDFLRDVAGSCRLMFHKFDRPIFRGLQTPDGDKDWNHGLWAVEADAYPHLESFLLSLTLVDQRAKRVYRAGAQDVLVADPLHVDRRPALSAACPLLPIVAFGVNASHRRVSLYWDDKAPAASLPILRYNPPDPDMVAFAKDVLVEENLDAALGTPDPMATAADEGDLQLIDIQSLPQAEQANLIRDIEAYKQKDRR